MSARIRVFAGDHRGFSLVEIAVASAIFAIAAVAIASLYVSTQRAFDYGSAQAFAQRQGTLLQEELQRRLQRAVDFSVAPCGSGTATASVRYTLPDNTSWCLHQDQKVGDNFPQLYVCSVDLTIPVFGGGPLCEAGSARSLTAQSQNINEMARRLGTELRVANTQFTALSTMSGTSGVIIAGRALDVRFDLHDGAMDRVSPAYTGMRFGFTTTLRN